MSKSYNNCIYLSDEPAVISKKISSYITDPARIHPTDLGHPEICPIFALHKIYSENYKELETLCKNGKIGCVKCKKGLAENIVKSLEPIQLKQKELKKNPAEINKILKIGGEKARAIAGKTINEIRDALKLWNTE